MDRLPQRGPHDLKAEPGSEPGAQPSPRVLLLTGAWFPESAGGSLQARSLALTCGTRARISVLCTSLDPGLPGFELDHGLPVRRVGLDLSSPASVARAAGQMAAWLWLRRRDYDVVHLVGFSRKSVLVAALASGLGKSVCLKLTSAGEDDPVSIRARGAVSSWALRQARVWVAPSPALRDLAFAATDDPGRVVLIPNGVDLDRFRPATAEERASERRALGLPLDGPLTLCVGHFSRDKRQDWLFQAWSRSSAARGVLAFAGSSSPASTEVHPEVAERVRSEARQAGLESRVAFLGHLPEIERAYRAADLLALASRREGQPNCLLEALASGLAIASVRLPGITDVLLSDGQHGLLSEVDDQGAYSRSLSDLCDDAELRERLGRSARVAASGYSLQSCAEAHLALWRRLT